ncbi:Carboxypeptidase A5 [Exaiptasia diaphana]|nr:Carboxypeptidase A5 [Exaiptasia diaphana]
MCFYKTCIRPVTEYAFQTFHDGLPRYLSEELETIQRRALKIISPALNYEQALNEHSMTTLHQRRKDLTEQLFKEINDDSNHKLYSLLPPRKSTNIALRRRRTFNTPISVHRWVLTSHERAAVTQACRKIAGIADEDDAGSVIKEMGESPSGIRASDYFGPMLVKQGRSTVKSDKVIRLIPKTLRHLKILDSLEQAEPEKYDFWTFPGSIGKSVDIHIKSMDYGNFTKFLDGHGIKYETLLYDIQRVIDHQNDLPVNANDATTDWYRKYHHFEEIVDKIHHLVKENKNKAKVELFSIGKSVRNKELWTVKLINGYGKSGKDDVTEILDKMDFVILPVLNPDGYAFSWQPKRRFWRKNRRPRPRGRVFRSVYCYGVDLNRNFPDHWDKPVGSKFAQFMNRFPCSPIYHGPRKESEIEIQSVVDYLTKLKQEDNLMAYFDIHSYSQMWMLPFGFTKERPPDYDEQRRVGLEGIKAIYKQSGKIPRGRVDYELIAHEAESARLNGVLARSPRGREV